MKESDEMYRELNERKREYLNFELKRITKEIEEMGGHYDKQYEDQWKAAISGESAPKHERMNNNVPTGPMPVTEMVEFPKEMNDWKKVLLASASSGHHKPNNWMDPNGSKSSQKDMYASMFRHLSESATGRREDKDSGLHPLLHLASRALMMYYRDIKGIYHRADKE